MTSDNIWFDAAEQSMIKRAKDLESDAKTLRKMAEEGRQHRAMRERLEETRRAKEINDRRKDISDRVHRLTVSLAEILYTNDLKIQDDHMNGGFQSRFILMDQRSTEKVELKAVNGKGFEWGIIEGKY